LQRLKQAVAQTQAQVEASQQQLIVLQQSLAALEQRLAQESQPSAAAAPLAASPAPPPPGRDDELQERQAIQESQIATLDQSKVGSESKYPVKIHGLILLNGFINTSQVDSAVTPVVAIPGSGSTGVSLRQTIFGVSARGPTLAGATSHADLDIDFFGSSTGQTTYADVGGVLRLRTAHASLDWPHSQAFFALDRPIISPNVPTSLAELAVPALAWSGNLWTWSPQVGFSHTLPLGGTNRLSFAAALMDVPDSPVIASTTSSISQSERSRWPGTELHIGFLGKEDNTGLALGVGGYFSPHKNSSGTSYNAWAGTLDLRLPLPKGLEFTGSFYRGLALGDLGGGAYKDYIFLTTGSIPLDDVGGWAQLKERATSRLEFNTAYGIDNSFASETRRYVGTYPTSYLNLARNQTFFANAIYSPSAYLLLSFEFRHIWSAPITGATANSNILGVAAGYKF
jgi:uncharacterized coiled-coil protein SlyX